MNNEDQISRVMHEMPYGLYIIGTKEPESGRVNGMMADWVMQVSFQPRLVAVSFENDSHSLGNIRERPHFTVNLLSQDRPSMELARSFAQPYSGEKIAGREGPEAHAVHYKLEGIDYHLSERGCPILDAALAWFECESAQLIPVGDHTLAIARVLDAAVHRQAEPLTSTYTGWTYSG